MDAKKEHMTSLKVLVDKKQNRVLFAEADKVFVDILLSFLTFPMGTIVRLFQKKPYPSEIGCLNFLYAALEKLDAKSYQSKEHKAILLRPINSSGHMCRKLKYNIDDTGPAKYLINGVTRTIVNDGNITDDPAGGGFVNGNSKFMITDDLRIVHTSSSVSFKYLNELGAQDLSAMEEKILNFGISEILSLLKLSWLSKTPLTDLYLRKHPEQSMGCTSQFSPACFKNPVNNCTKLVLKIFLRKSDGKFLYVEANEDFIDYLLSLLSIPLGAVVKLLDSPPLTCIINLYQSVKLFNVDRDIRTESHKAKLISPKIAPQFSYKIQLLGINEFFYPEGKCQTQRVGSECVSVLTLRQLSGYEGYLSDACPVAENGFVKKPTTFIVMDNLSFTPLSLIENLFLLNKLNVHISDIEEHTMNFGGEEALRLLAASLTTTSALYYALKLNEKKPKIEK